MDSVGVRDLKNHLSRHLRRVRAGARIVVTERGRSIATIVPADAPPRAAWAEALVAAGRAQWSGGKPAGARRPARIAGGRAAAAVLEDRR
ncbi:MAG: type II toxin-antitoxin system Phd/YefM family antitoxin [Vicinamibacterales bacterium]